MFQWGELIMFLTKLWPCSGDNFANEIFTIKRLIEWFVVFILQILRKYKLDYSGREMGMIHMPFTTPDKPLDIKFTPREQ
jgi:hypothetical protein